MPPKTKDSKPAAVDPEAAAAEQKALMESELVTAVLRSRLGRSVMLEQLCKQLAWCIGKKAMIMLPCTFCVDTVCTQHVQVSGCRRKAGSGKLLFDR
jgi:hypothetical protein